MLHHFVWSDEENGWEVHDMHFWGFAVRQLSLGTSLAVLQASALADEADVTAGR